MAIYGDNHAEWGAAALEYGVPAGNLDERHDAQLRLHDAAEAVCDAVDELRAIVGMELEGRASESLPTLEVARARLGVEERRLEAIVDESLAIIEGRR